MATKQIAWDDGSGDHLQLTYQGQGNGSITVASDTNNGAARSKTIVIETTAGSPIVTKNLTVNQSACPVPVGTVLNYAYTGNYQEIELPAGQYKLQCWGAQGGSNAAASSYGITAKAGGKGGYSEGILTLTSKTTVRIYVGGAGSSSAGGFNGGGSTTGSSSYSASNENGVSRMGGGGGATDIRLSDAALLSRMIVAGGGSGGAMCYRSKTTSTTTKTNISNSAFVDGDYVKVDGSVEYNRYIASTDFISVQTGDVMGKTEGTDTYCICARFDANKQSLGYTPWPYTIPSDTKYVRFIRHSTYAAQQEGYSLTVPYIQRTTTSTTTSNDSQVGFAGGGTTGVGYSSTYQGKQNAAGSGGSFGQGAAQSVTNYRYCSGAGGGGWYGGGSSYSDSSMTNCKYSGGGSGFVNTAANAQYRPSGYTGLQLDSGETKAGNTSFPSTSGGTETGHSGNGYAKITRIS